MSAGVQARGKVVIGTVKDGLHDIGKNLVEMMMEGMSMRAAAMTLSPSTSPHSSKPLLEVSTVQACS